MTADSNDRSGWTPVVCTRVHIKLLLTNGCFRLMSSYRAAPRIHPKISLIT